MEERSSEREISKDIKRERKREREREREGERERERDRTREKKIKSEREQNGWPKKQVVKNFKTDETSPDTTQLAKSKNYNQNSKNILENCHQEAYS